MPSEGTAAYSQGHDESVVRTHASRTAESEAGFLLPHLRNDMSILDCGCGPGSITCDFAGIVNQGSVIGIDLSPEIIDQAKSLADSRGLRNVTFQPANILEGLPFSDNTFDVVYCHQFLLHIPEPVRALKEIYRVCKPSGLVACREADLEGLIIYPMTPGFQKFWDAYCQMVTSNGASMQAGRQVHVWARKAGFDPEKIVKSSSITLHATQEKRDLFGGGFMDRLKKSQIRENLLAAGNSQADLDEMSQGIDQWRTDPDGWGFTPHGEILCTK